MNSPNSRTLKLAWLGFLAMTSAALPSPRRGLWRACSGLKYALGHIRENRRQLSSALVLGLAGAAVGAAWSISSSSAFLAVEVFAEGMDEMSKAERQLPKLEHPFSAPALATPDADQLTDRCAGSKNREWRGTAIMSAAAAASCIRFAEDIASWQENIISRFDLADRSGLKNPLYVEMLLGGRGSGPAFSEALFNAESRDEESGSTLKEKLSKIAARWTFASKLLLSNAPDNSPPFAREQENMASNMAGACSILGLFVGAIVGLFLSEAGIAGAFDFFIRMRNRARRAAALIKQRAQRYGARTFGTVAILAGCWAAGSTLSFALMASVSSSQYSLAPAWVLDGALSRMCDDDSTAKHCDSKLRARVSAALDESPSRRVAIQSATYSKIQEELSSRFASDSQGRFFKNLSWSSPRAQSFSSHRSAMRIRQSSIPIVDAPDFSAWLPLDELPAWRSKTMEKITAGLMTDRRLSEPWQDWTAREWIAVAENQAEISAMLAEASKPETAMAPSSYEAAAPWTNIPPEFKMAIIEEKLLPALREARSLPMAFGGIGLLMAAVAIVSFLFQAASLSGSFAKAKAAKAIKTLERRGEAAAALAEREDLLSATMAADGIAKKPSARL